MCYAYQGIYISIWSQNIIWSHGGCFVLLCSCIIAPRESSMKMGMSNCIAQNTLSCNHFSMQGYLLLALYTIAMHQQINTLQIGFQHFVQSRQFKMEKRIWCWMTQLCHGLYKYAGKTLIHPPFTFTLSSSLMEFIKSLTHCKKWPKYLQTPFCTYLYEIPVIWFKFHCRWSI